MAGQNAVRDKNNVPSALGVSTASPTETVRWGVNPVTGRALAVALTGAAAAVVGLKVTRDKNGVPVAAGVSSADGKTLIPLHVSPATGALLVQ